jgi:hypothetical protein
MSDYPPSKAKYNKKYWLANRDKYRGYGRIHNQHLRSKIKNDPRALQLDHINRAREINRWHRSGTGLYRKILSGEKCFLEFQLLCANCNWIKRIENNENGTPGKRWFE